MIQHHYQHLSDGERAGLRYRLGLPRQAPSGLTGAALAHRAGSSLEFKEYRDYQPGDDLRHVDWNASARTDQLTLRLYREEMLPQVDIVIDRSRSMDLEGTAKARAVLGLAGFFTAAATNAGFGHHAWVMTDRIDPVGNGGDRPANWETFEFDYRAAGEGSPGRDTPRWRPRGIRVLLSDLFWAGDPLQLIGPLAERAAIAVVVQVLAEVDVNPPPAGSLRLIDAETDQVRELIVDAAAVRRYRDALTRHQEQWYRACRQAGALFLTVVAEHFVRDWTLDELVAADVLQVS